MKRWALGGVEDAESARAGRRVTKMQVSTVVTAVWVYGTASPRFSLSAGDPLDTLLRWARQRRWLA